MLLPSTAHQQCQYKQWKSHPPSQVDFINNHTNHVNRYSRHLNQCNHTHKRHQICKFQIFWTTNFWDSDLMITWPQQPSTISCKDANEQQHSRHMNQWNHSHVIHYISNFQIFWMANSQVMNTNTSQWPLTQIKANTPATWTQVFVDMKYTIYANLRFFGWLISEILTLWPLVISNLVVHQPRIQMKTNIPAT